MERKLDQLAIDLRSTLVLLEKQEKSMSLLDDKIADLTTEVAKNTTIATSAVALLRAFRP